MSVIRPKPPEDPLVCSVAPLLTTLGLATDDLGRTLTGLSPTNESVGKLPLANLPERLLAAYNGLPGEANPAGRTRASSELFAVLQTARFVRDTVDRVVVLGDTGYCEGVRAIFTSCCHPCHNELPRGERGGRPRLSVVGAPADDDSLQGLVDLVAPIGVAGGHDLLDQWAVVAGDDRTAASAAATAILLKHLRRWVGGDPQRFAERFVPVSGGSGELAALAAAVGCPRSVPLADAPAERGVFTAAGLLPAAIVGIDVVRLLQGAAAMTRRSREASPTENPVLQFVAASRLTASRLGAAPRLTSPDTDRLLDLVLWHERCVTAAAGSSPVRIRTLAPIFRLDVGAPRRDPRAASPAPAVGCEPDDVARSLDRLVDARPEATASGAADMACIRLPRIDEHTIGQLMQMLLLAAAVEERLAG